MNKSDWLDYFEAINGRTPSAEELANALAQGEFQEEVPVSSAQSTVYDVTEEPAPAVNQVSQDEILPNHVQTPVNPASTYSAPQGTVTPAQPSALAETTKGFWAWLVDAWKAPHKGKVSAGQYDGYITFGILSFLLTLTLFTYARSAVNIGTNAVNSLLGEFGGSSSSFQNPVGANAFFMILLAAVLYVFSIFFASFAARRFVYQDTNYTFSKSFSFLGRLVSLNIILLVASWFFALVHVPVLSALILILAFALFSLGNLFVIVDAKNQSSMDSFYKFILAIVTNNLILGVFGFIELSMISSYLSSVFSSFSSLG